MGEIPIKVLSDVLAGCTSFRLNPFRRIYTSSNTTIGRIFRFRQVEIIEISHQNYLCMPMQYAAICEGCKNEKL